jgi:tetratricopeptide (TPR) repeat protein
LNGIAETAGTLDIALAHAARLLETDQPALAIEQAGEILKTVPGHPVATRLLGLARRAAGDFQAAVDTLEALCRSQPKWAEAHFDLGLAYGVAGQGDAAVVALRRAVQLKPDFADAWRSLGDYLAAIGDTTGSDGAYLQQVRASTKDPRLRKAAAALYQNEVPSAEALLREHLKQHPTDVAAIRMLAEVAARLERYTDAENLLVRCLELAPSFTPARRNYATVLQRQNRHQEALEQVERLLRRDPGDPGVRNLKAAILGGIGRYDESIGLYATVLAEFPNQSRVWLNYGHALKTVGRPQESVDAYRESLRLEAGLGAAYWSLANLKTFRFTPNDVVAMRSQLKRTDLSDEDRLHLEFALGKALEDSGDFAESFEHYVTANRLRRAGHSYSAERTSARVRRSKTLFTEEFFAERRGFGSPAKDPIFIVGLPRAGSTLLEQILSSHSLVEGTMELPDLLAIAARLMQRAADDPTQRYPRMLSSLSAGDCRALGQEYLERTRIQRHSDAPFFIDKMPNNWAHVGLIQLILPNARIIDARRHPLGCCFSGFKQHFARGQMFSYSLEDLGRYYFDYVDLMAHFDAALPRRVHRVFYEQMIDNAETEIRRLLDYCGLPFEESCLRHYENDRAVRTASSEQVRKPIFRDAIDHWRHYEPWLGPLQAALGPVLAAYPGVPEFAGTVDSD